MADDKKIIFSMVGVSKIFPPQKQVLKNIYLSFFYGAKIGIIGLNGSGKSTLLKIIAGIEKEYQGEVVFSPGYSVGYLEQDPKLEPGKTVKEIVQEGVQDIVDTLKEYEEVNEKFGDPEVLEDPDKMDALINRQAELQDKIDATDAWNLDSRLERAMDALRCPPEDQVVDTPCSSLPFIAATAGRPVTGRTDQPLGCRIDRLAGATFTAICGYGYLYYARPLLPRPCSRMDSGTGPRRRYPLERKLLFLAGSKDQTYGTGRKAGKQTS